MWEAIPMQTIICYKVLKRTVNPHTDGFWYADAGPASCGFWRRHFGRSDLKIGFDLGSEKLFENYVFCVRHKSMGKWKIHNSDDLGSSRFYGDIKQRYMDPEKILKL